MQWSAHGNATSIGAFWSSFLSEAAVWRKKVFDGKANFSSIHPVLPGDAASSMTLLHQRTLSRSHHELDLRTDLRTAGPSPCPFHFFGQLGQLQTWGWTAGNRSSQYGWDVLCVIQLWPKALSARGRMNHSDQPSTGCTRAKNNIYLPSVSCTSYVSCSHLALETLSSSPHQSAELP